MDQQMMICPECKGVGHWLLASMGTAKVCPACNGTGKVSACISVPSTHVEALSITPASEGKFNNALQADALDWDTRNIEPQPTSEIMLEQSVSSLIEAPLRGDCGIEGKNRKVRGEIEIHIISLRRENG